MDTLAVLWDAGSIPFCALAFAFAFEAVNGFHDTANAVATVIYTHSLRPITAVVLSGVCNALGVLAGGTAVAFTIVHLLPVELLVAASPAAGTATVLALLLGAMTWNVGTWYLGLPSSSSHALIGAILGVGLVHGGLAGVNWQVAYNVILSLLLSPALGFVAAAALLRLARWLAPDPELYEPADHRRSPPWWIRGILMGTCSAVSFAHGSNDGQKGMGLVMLVLIGLVPTYFTLNLHASAAHVRRAEAAASAIEGYLAQHKVPLSGSAEDNDDPGARARCLASELRLTLRDAPTLAAIPQEERWRYRTHVLRLRESLKDWALRTGRDIPIAPLRELTATIEYVPLWVIAGVSLALGLGTMVGWRRIVITVGERIGKAHLAYAQGASAELVAAGTIGLADVAGLPVSTTHVLSSGVAGTMWANHSGVQLGTLRKIGLAWALTLPATMALSGVFYSIFWLLL